jgi:DNA-binding IclR family transcriptional regulator
VAGNSTDSGRSVTSKVVAILTTFTDGSVHSLTEIARLAGLPISTAHRLASELTASSLLERTEDGDYRVGTPLRAICTRSGQAPSIAERAPRVMEDLSTAARAEVRLGILEDLEVAYIEKGPGHQPVSTFSSAARLPAHATALGKALLAFSDRRVVDLIVARGLKPYTPYTLTAPDRFRRALAMARLNRVAVARWELDLGVCTVAAPVFGVGGHVVAALELRVRDLRGELPVVQPVLTVAARSLSRELAALPRPDRLVPQYPRPQPQTRRRPDGVLADRFATAGAHR